MTSRCVSTGPAARHKAATRPASEPHSPLCDTQWIPAATDHTLMISPPYQTFYSAVRISRPHRRLLACAGACAYFRECEAGRGPVSRSHYKKFLAAHPPLPCWRQVQALLESLQRHSIDPAAQRDLKNHVSSMYSVFVQAIGKVREASKQCCAVHPLQCPDFPRIRTHARGAFICTLP